METSNTVFNLKVDLRVGGIILVLHGVCKISKMQEGPKELDRDAEDHQALGGD